jgi:hypothetical protein
MQEKVKLGFRIGPSIIISVIISLSIAASLYLLLWARTAKIAYIDTGRLIVGFSAANDVEKEVKIEDDKWQGQLKILQDSLQAQVDRERAGEGLKPSPV